MTLNNKYKRHLDDIKELKESAVLFCFYIFNYLTTDLQSESTVAINTRSSHAVYSVEAGFSKFTLTCKLDNNWKPEMTVHCVKEKSGNKSTLSYQTTSQKLKQETGSQE